VAAILLYGQIVGYGVWVASGVIEEKSSRVVELLLSTIRPRQLLAGKIFGIGSLGFLQLLLIGAYAGVVASALGVVRIPAYTIGTLGIVLGWFALGFTFYACVFAVAGALVSRQEDLQNAVVPINLTMLGSLAFAIVAAQKPDVWVVKVGSFLPVSSPLVMPARIALGVTTWWEVLLSLAILMGSIALLIPTAGRLYSSAILKTAGRQRIRDAWRAAGD
jgi:ABC-2 type transport system permease protein